MMRTRYAELDEFLNEEEIGEFESVHCPNCGIELDTDYDICPQCDSLTSTEESEMYDDDEDDF